MWRTHSLIQMFEWVNHFVYCNLLSSPCTYDFQLCGLGVCAWEEIVQLNALQLNKTPANRQKAIKQWKHFYHFNNTLVAFEKKLTAVKKYILQRDNAYSMWHQEIGCRYRKHKKIKESKFEIMIAWLWYYWRYLTLPLVAWSSVFKPSPESVVLQHLQHVCFLNVLMYSVFAASFLMPCICYHSGKDFCLHVVFLFLLANIGMQKLMGRIWGNAQYIKYN